VPREEAHAYGPPYRHRPGADPTFGQNTSADVRIDDVG
jgi:hypothetical protein